MIKVGWGQIRIQSDDNWTNLTYINSNYPGWEDGFQIDPGIKLTIDGINGLTLAFNEGSTNSIVLDEGAFLEIKNGAILTCNNSNDFWGGISANGDITINNYTNNPTFDPNTKIVNYWSATKDNTQTWVKINSNSKIQRAAVGVQVYNGAIVEIENAEFTNSVTGYKNDNLNSYSNSYASHIMNTTFEWNNSLSPFQTNVPEGINLGHMFGLLIGGCTFIDNRSSRCLENRANGINANSSGFFVGESGNTDCVDNFGCPANCYNGILGTSCTFSNLNYGILYQNGYDVNYSFLCRRNNFIDNFLSIKTTNTRNNKIYENIFNGNRATLNNLFDQFGCLEDYSPSDIIKHIEFSNANNLEIYNNNFSFTGSDIYYIHSLANNNSANKQRIQNNVFSNANNQTTAAFNVFGVYAQAATPNLGIFCNNFGSMGVDIEISSNGSVLNTMQRFGIIGGVPGNAGANNSFSTQLANRFRIRNNNSANTLNYACDLLNPNFDPIFPIKSTNINVIPNNGELSCNLTCSSIIDYDNGGGGTSVNHQKFALINIFPNPFNDVISITSSKEISKIEIYNNIGQVVYSIDNINVFEHSLNLNILESGLYFIKINGEFNQKIIKQ